MIPSLSGAGQTPPGDRIAIGPVMVCLLMALLPLAFATSLFEPYVAAKQLVLVGGAAVLALVCALTLRVVTVSSFWLPVGMLAALAGVSLPRVDRYDTAICFVAGFVLFAVAGAEMRDGSSRETLAATITTVGIVEAIYVLWQAIAGDPLLPVQDVPGKWRMFGTFGNPNWTGEFLAVAILVTYGRQAARFSIARALWQAVMLAALCATFARGAWLSLAVGVAAFAWCRREAFLPALRRALVASAGMVAATAGLLLFRPDALPYLTNLESIRGRFWMSLVTARMIWDAPWGVGLGSFGRAFPEVQARLLDTPYGRSFLHHASFPRQAHSDYLQLVAEIGIFALPVLVVLVRRIVVRGPALARDPVALGFWAALLALMMNALVASPLYLPGSLGCAAILLGVTQAAGGSRTVRMPRGGLAVIGTAALAFCAVASIWCWNRGIAEYQMDRASRAIALRQWPQAGAALEAAQRHDPSRLEIYSLLGRLQLAQRQFTMAAKTYSRAATLGPDEEVLAGWASALWYQGRRGEALQVLERLAWQRPDLEWPRRKLAQLRPLSAQKELVP